MQRVIYKYSIYTKGPSRQVINLPVREFGSKKPIFLHVGLGINDKPFVWVEQDVNNVEPLIKLKEYAIHIIGTEETFDIPNLVYLGSFVEEAYYVWHIYREDN